MRDRADIDREVNLLRQRTARDFGESVSDASILSYANILLDNAKHAEIARTFEDYAPAELAALVAIITGPLAAAPTKLPRMRKGDK